MPLCHPLWEEVLAYSLFTPSVLDVGNNMLYWSCGVSMQGSVAKVPTFLVCLLCLCSYDLCSEFVCTGPAAHYLSKVSPCSADQPYILLIYDHSPLVTLPGNFPFFAVYISKNQLFLFHLIPSYYILFLLFWG